MTNSKRGKPSNDLLRGGEAWTEWDIPARVQGKEAPGTNRHSNERKSNWEAPFNDRGRSGGEFKYVGNRGGFLLRAYQTAPARR